MLSMPIVDLLERGRKLAATGMRVSVLWQSPDSLCFCRPRPRIPQRVSHQPRRRDHVYDQGEMRLHSRTPEGKEQIDLIPQGSIIYTPAGTPHSPRFPPDAFALISERKRRDGEVDRFHWYCPKCDALLHEETFVVSDYAEDPVSNAYKRFFDSEDYRTCKKCGEIMPAPDLL